MDTASAYRKGLALLAVLAAAGERGVSRDAVLALLWPDSDEERARTSLRQLVHLLRNQLQSPDLIPSSPELRLNPRVISSDVADFRAALETDDLAAAVELYRGPFLDGFYIRSADELERWIATERAGLASDAARALETLAQRTESAGDVRAAVTWWRRLTELDPISASGAIGLMRCLDAVGERAAALRHARVHELLVQSELGEATDDAVSAFADRLRNSTQPPADVPAESGIATPARPVDNHPPTVRATDSHPATASATAIDPPKLPVDEPEAEVAAVTAVTRRRHRLLTAAAALVVAFVVIAAVAILSRPRAATHTFIAVLPLANTSGDTTTEAISDGLTENLITSLGAIPDVRVIGRTSAFLFRERSLDLRAIADSLGASAVLDGSVQRSGDQLKIGVQLVSAADGTVVWAETYDRRLTDFFAIQDEITRAIIDALRLRVGRATARADTLRDVRAYELYLRGRHIFTTRTDREGTDHARQYFEAALERDSLLAYAHAGLSDVYTRLAIFAHMPARAGFARAGDHARRALALDSTLAEAHAALGHKLCVADFDWDASDRAFERAIALNPNYLFGRMPYAVCLMSRGRFHEAERQLLHARETDPLSPAPSNLLGRLYVNMQQPDRAIDNLRQALELSPQMDLAWQQLGHARLQQGMAAEAIDAFERAATLSGTRDSLHLAYALAVTGRTGDARRILTDLTSSGHTENMAYHFALAATGLGDLDRAFAWLERGFDEQGSFVGSAAVDPALAPLRADPRWPMMLRRMRLE
ncbi:MAG TPA: BTAD domain-containing putative transcriptional regulator [Longimicrobiales bacterium]|nr:BTAD domain-containing putative transcriptional regulator [Longimicrobiales bacterium]